MRLERVENDEKLSRCAKPFLTKWKLISHRHRFFPKWEDADEGWHYRFASCHLLNSIFVSVAQSFDVMIGLNFKMVMRGMMQKLRRVNDETISFNSEKGESLSL